MSQFRLPRGLKLAAHDPAEAAWLEETEQWLYHAETVATTVVEIPFFTNPTTVNPLLLHPALSSSNGSLPSPKVFVGLGLSAVYTENVSTHADRFNDLVLLLYGCYWQWFLGERTYFYGPSFMVTGGGMGTRLVSEGSAADRVAASNGFAPCFSVANVPVTIAPSQTHYLKFVPQGAVTITTARRLWAIIRGVLGREL